MKPQATTNQMQNANMF